MCFKVGDEVKIFLDEEIKKARDMKKKSLICPGVLDLWENINGRVCTIINIINDDEIWVKNDKMQEEIMFNRNTLVKF